ncbi:coiled-coil domain-containing protein 25 [Salpingoeca rosetta]|uniref:Coiled-coil domain-containing protein 25 n=1 Tax=Salpingoeca rosetta (strain ATCC 50818 / BSB-021) TaxID=946362 RepID=F2UPV4_SALR5|nr:coiled-coil domain-containing protein 25 [Salpingoeca rosetta]EGD79659.1 coiled-coil domain-containing protein 25 [Salpingoeca rosetta]|eukprot:XP_004988887.1 coiled-coil domain-containing protein 25 [Salpingoeca rosetta]
MVFYFDTEIDGKTYHLYMGKDKYENEDLIAYGWPDDLWFHVDSLSSAHVYVRLPEGEGHLWKELPDQLIEECCQLVKQNSIEGCKKTNVRVVYTPWANLKKTSDMEVGQVSFHSRKELKYFTVEKRNKEILKKLYATKDERHPDLKHEQSQRHARELRKKKKEQQQRRQQEKLKVERKREEKKLKTYETLQDEALMETNKHGMSVDDYEDDFM